LLERQRPHIFCEILLTGRTDDEMDGIAAELGYTVYALETDGFKPVRPVRASSNRRNYLFTVWSESDLHASLARALTSGAQSMPLTA
jgi:hypothetical protein